MTKISIIIVSFNRHIFLCDTVRALLCFIDPETVEIIVVDQRPLEVLPLDERSLARIRYLVLPDPGMVPARNAGLAVAKGEIALFLDDDVIPLPGLIEAHLGAYRDPSIGGVAGRIVDPPGVISHKTADPRMFDPKTGWEFADFDHDTPGDVMTSRGCNMSFRRSLIQELGGFDSNIEIFRDDSDMCLRMLQAGYRIRFVPEAALVHLNASSGGTRGNEAQAPGYWTSEWRSYKQHYRHYRDNLYFLLRHFRGSHLKRLLWEAYRSYVGISRWPWRLVAKNLAFLLAFWRAWRMTGKTKLRPISPAQVSSLG